MLNHGTDEKSYLRLAKKALNRKQYARAITLYEKYVSLDKNKSDAWNNLGYAYFLSDEMQNAIRCFKMAISINRNDPYAWHYLGHCYQQQDKFNKAVECFNQELRIDPSYAHSWNEKGYSLFVSSKGSSNQTLRLAIKCYDKSLKIKPRYADALSNKGTALYILNELNEANKCYEKALKIKPNDIYTLYYNGQCLQDLNRYADAILSFKKQHRLAKNEYDDTLYQTGLCYFLLKNFKEAEHFLSLSLRKENKDNTDALVALAHTSSLLGQNKKARKYLKKIIYFDKIKQINVDKFQQGGRRKIDIKYYVENKTIIER